MESSQLEGLSPIATLTIHPTALTARRAVQAALRPAGVAVGSRETTFPELTDLLARQLGVNGRVIPAELAPLVLEAAIGDLPDLAAAFRRHGRGLVRELLAAIDELKAARLAPGDVREAGRALAGFDAALRVDELARVYEAYERRLAGMRALDRHGREWEVAERLAGCLARGERPAALDGVSRVVFAEIYDFSVLQFLIATALIRLVGDAELIAFAHPENVDATRFLERTWNRFVAAEPIAEQVLPSFVVRGGRQGSLAAVLRAVFAQPGVPPTAGDGSIRVLAAPHRYGEVEAVLRDVRRRLERGADPAGIALLARDIAPYAEQIDDVARRFRVPVAFRRGQALLGSAAVREVLDAARAAADGLPSAALGSLAASDYFRIRRRQAAGLLDAVGYVADGVCPLEQCFERLAASTEPETAALRRRAARERPALVGLAATLRALGGTRTLGEHVHALRAALRRLGFRPVGRETLDPVAAARDARAWAHFDDLLDALAAMGRALGSRPHGLEEFLALLVAVAETASTRAVETSGGVSALSILDARGLEFDTVYVLGLDDGTFPAPRRESAVLPDAIKRPLGTAALGLLRKGLGERAAGLHGGLLRTAREATLEDPFLFFLALSMAAREAVLVYPTADERGNATVRSPFIDEVAACLAEPLPETRIDPATLVPAAGECCDEGEIVGRAALERWRGGERAPDVLGPLLRTRLPDGTERLADLDRRAVVERARLRYFLMPLGPVRDAAADPWVGRVPPERALAARIDALVWSPTRLEQLAACGFKFFAHRVLGVRERDEARAELTARDRGTLLHRIVEGVLRAMQPWPHDLAEARRQARRVAEELRAASTGALHPKDPALLDVEWGRVLRVVDDLAAVEADEQRRTDAAGLRVERRLEWPFAFDLAGPHGPVSVHGKADRVDRWWRGEVLERLRVRDYKTARSTRGLREAAARGGGEERRLGYQIPVYLGAAVREAACVPAAMEGGYWALLAPPRDRDRTRPLAAAELERAEEDLRALVATARAGVFDVAPHACDEWCPYRTVCRYQPPPVEDERG